MGSATNTSSSGQFTLTYNDLHFLICEMGIINKHLTELSRQFNDRVCVRSLEFLELYNRYPMTLPPPLPMCASSISFML